MNEVIKHRAILWIVLLNLAFGNASYSQEMVTESWPITFLDAPPSTYKDFDNSLFFYGKNSFETEDALQEAKTWSSWMVAATIRCELVGEKAGPPIHILTGPTEPLQSIGQAFEHLHRIGASQIFKDPRSSTWLKGPSSIRLLDLFAFRAQNDVNELIGRAASLQTLILPFTGARIRDLDKLPKTLKKLVIYNSFINKLDLERVFGLTELEELVLWGCSLDWESLSINESDVFGAKPVAQTVPKLKKISLLNCCYMTSEWLCKTNFPLLETLVHGPNARFIMKMDNLWKERMPKLMQYTAYCVAAGKNKSETDFITKSFKLTSREMGKNRDSFQSMQIWTK
jgi:hypothetical protein